MSLFELIVVVIIVGIVYSLGIFSLKNEKVIPLIMNVSSIKTTLLSLSDHHEIRMVCDTSCHECTIFDRDGKVLSTVMLVSDAPVYRYEFNRFGELQKLGNTVVQGTGGLVQGCFEVTLSSNDVISPLILKSENTFYLYTPMGEKKPYMSTSEAEVRTFIFDESHYPVRGDTFYGAL